MSKGVVVFTLGDFERALPHGCVSLGLVEGEYCYLLPVTENAGILIRSSVDRLKVSAYTGDDSIRVYPARVQKIQSILGTSWSWKIHGKSQHRWLTRIVGWERRLGEAIEVMRDQIERAGTCSVCGEPRLILQVKKDGANKGRWFGTCKREHDTPRSQFVWLS